MRMVKSMDRNGDGKVSFDEMEWAVRSDKGVREG